MIKFFKYIILLFILSIPPNLFASDINSKDTIQFRNAFWIGFGIGYSYFGPNLSAIIAYKNNQNIFSVKYSKSDEFNFGVDNNFDSPYLSIREYSILYGRALKEKIILFNILIGLSYITGVERGKNIQYNDFEKVNISTMSIPFETEVMFEFTDYIGIGILYYGNINKDKYFGGGMLRIKIGWF